MVLASCLTRIFPSSLGLTHGLRLRVYLTRSKIWAFVKGCTVQLFVDLTKDCPKILGSFVEGSCPSLRHPHACNR